MNTGARVALTDARDELRGIVMTCHSDGMCVVKWDASGVTERIHESELREVTRAFDFKTQLRNLWHRMAK